MLALCMLAELAKGMSSLDRNGLRYAEIFYSFIYYYAEAAYDPACNRHPASIWGLRYVAAPVVVTATG